MKELQRLIRKNILDLKAYSSARDEFTGTASTYIDANENPYDWEFNRYPDSKHFELKNTVAAKTNMPKDSITIGHGSDELIDLIIRIFCEPSKDSIRILDPSYGMYKVSAQINDIGITKESLTEEFIIPAESILLGPDPKSLLPANEKILFLCSPNNPTGNCLSTSKLEYIIKHYPGIVVLDEAYIDFSTQTSFRNKIAEFPNLIVLQTMSKSFAAAGLRIGIAYTNPYITSVLHKVKPPYNISSIALKEADRQWQKFDRIQAEIRSLIENRALLAKVFGNINCIKKIFPSEANFLLIRVTNAKNIYQFLIENGIVARLRSSQLHCSNCIRISVGTPEENSHLVKVLKSYNNEK